MRETLFIDTGAFYARYVARDEYHQKSLVLWKKIQKERLSCITSNFILSELITLFVYRFGTPKALQAAREIYTTPSIRIVSVSLELELNALEWLERFSDQSFSMTDATSFALMKQEGLKTAFTFDADFEIAGFQSSF